MISKLKLLRYPIKKIKHFLFPYFMISVIFCLHIWAGEIKGPSMIIQEPDFDAREVKEGTLIEHSFTFKNEGDTLLEIKRVDPG